MHIFKNPHARIVLVRCAWPAWTARGRACQASARPTPSLELRQLRRRNTGVTLKKSQLEVAA